MTKGTREVRKMARLERELKENPEEAIKKIARENRKYKNYQDLLMNGYQK